MRWGRRSPGQARGGSDLEPGPRAAQDGGLAGHGPPLQGVQDPVLLKLGDVLQGVPGAVTGGSGECGLVGVVAPTVRGPLPARPSASHQGWGPQGSSHSLPRVALPPPHSGPGQWGSAGRRPRGPGRCPPALTSRIGSTTPGWQGPGGRAGASRAPGSADAPGPAAAAPPPGKTSPVWPCPGRPR